MNQFDGNVSWGKIIYCKPLNLEWTGELVNICESCMIHILQIHMKPSQNVMYIDNVL